MNDYKRIIVVAFESAPFPGGQGTVSWQISKALSEAGHIVSLIAPYYDGSYVIDMQEEFDVIRILKHQKMEARSIIHIRKLIESYDNIDLVISCDIRASLCLALAFPTARLNKAIIYHGGEVRRGVNNFIGKVINKFAALNAKTLLANSKFSADLVKSVIGRDCHIMNLGVGSEWLTDSPNNSECCCLNDIDEDAFVAVTVARITERKGQDTAIQALDLLSKIIDRNVVYLIIGRIVDEAFYLRLKKKALEVNVDVRFFDSMPLEDIKKVYKKSDIFLLPAKSTTNYIEGFGLVLIEAGTQNCPGVAYNVGGIGEAIVNNVTGFVVEEGNMSELVDRMLMIERCSDVRLELASGAYQFSKSFSWDQAANKILKEAGL